MKEPKPFRSPHTSPGFPEAEAAILIFLELAKKKSTYLHRKLAHTPYSTPLPLFRCCTHMSIVIRRVGPHISSAEPQYSQRGSALFFKPLRSSAGWERCVS